MPCCNKIRQFFHNSQNSSYNVFFVRVFYQNKRVGCMCLYSALALHISLVSMMWTHKTRVCSGHMNGVSTAPFVLPQHIKFSIAYSSSHIAYSIVTLMPDSSRSSLSFPQFIRSVPKAKSFITKWLLAVSSVAHALHMVIEYTLGSIHFFHTSLVNQALVFVLTWAYLQGQRLNLYFPHWLQAESQ